MAAIRVGIIGQGRSGHDIHAKHLVTDKRYKIVAVVDELADRRQIAEQEFGCDTYADYKDMLKRKDLDIIINASFSQLHVPITLAALAAGQNVLCEKPLADKSKDVDKLIAASKKARKLLAIFQQSRFAPAFQQVRKVIQSGVLGRIVQVDMQVNGFARRWDWQTLQVNNGGSLLNTGPHPLDQALRLLDYPGMPEVTCFMDRVNTFGDAEDHVSLTLRAPGKPFISLEVSSCCAYPGFGFNVYGSQGGMKADGTHADWKFFKPKEAPKQKLIREPLMPGGKPAYCREQLKWHEGSWDVPAKDTDLFAANSRYFYDMLFKTLTKGAPLEITPEQIRQQIQVIEACQKANPRVYTKWAKKSRK